MFNTNEDGRIVLTPGLFSKDEYSWEYVTLETFTSWWIVTVVLKDSDDFEWAKTIFISEIRRFLSSNDLQNARITRIQMMNSKRADEGWELDDVVKVASWTGIRKDNSSGKFEDIPEDILECELSNGKVFTHPNSGSFTSTKNDFKQLFPVLEKASFGNI